jgi:phosphate transport system protein
MLCSPAIRPSAPTMPSTPDGFSTRLAHLKADIAEQGRRVQALLEQAFDSAFALDLKAAKQIEALDDIIDKVDVEIEKSAVQLLTDATAAGAALPPDQLRMVLTIVKVNNELERIADQGVAIAELVPELNRQNFKLPDTLRVITNSCVGILRDAGTSLERSDPHLAKTVLASEDAVEQFKRAIMREAQMQVAKGALTVDAAFALNDLTNICEMLSEHCTNIAEQALYVSTGTIVRHLAGHWQEVPKH